MDSLVIALTVLGCCRQRRYRLLVWLVKRGVQQPWMSPVIYMLYAEVLAECVTSFAFPNVTSIAT